MTRVASLGNPAREIREWHEGVREAQRAALAAIRPGVGGCDVDAAAREVLERFATRAFRRPVAAKELASLLLLAVLRRLHL